MIGLIPVSVFAEDKPGKQVFQEICAGCHTIGGGRLVGPDLKGIHDRRSQQWLLEFVKSSQTMIGRGDAQAVALFKEYNNLPMPDMPVSEHQIKQILQYIQTAGDRSSGHDEEAASEPVTPAQVATDKRATKEDIIRGQNIFQGVLRLENGGPACNGCHHVKNDAVIGGGILARELTSVFSRMGGPAVRSILGSAPFPVMKAAYLDKPLTKQETSALVAFFQQADQDRAYQRPRDYGVGLFISGVIGAGVLLAFYSLLWSRRKKNSVNQSIYDRQIKSS